MEDFSELSKAQDALNMAMNQLSAALPEREVRALGYRINELLAAYARAIKQPSKDALAYLAWLKEQIESAKEECKENIGFPNSYGAGYDSGVLRGLLDAYEYFAGEAYVR